MAQTTIQGSFLGDATVTGAKIGADFISAQTELTTTLATTDEIIVSDAGVIKRIDISVWSASTETFTNKTLTTPIINGGTLNDMTVFTVANDIDVGAYEVRALKFESDQATGTAPLTVASTTVVTNLNADLLDGVQGASYSQIAAAETLLQKTLTSPVLNTGVSGTAILDEDNLATNSATQLATQQSIKAYVDNLTTGIDWETSARTANFTAVAGKGYAVDCSGAARTVTLPAGTVGDIIAITDYSGNAATNNITITANGSEKIQGVDGEWTLTVNRMSVHLVYFDTTQGWIIPWGTTTAPLTESFAPTGGTTSDYSGYKVHSFLSGSTNFVVNVSGTIDVLMVAGGGGGGGHHAGAGGAGGVIVATGITIAAGTYAIVVGAGGAGQTIAGVNGTNTTAFGATAIGGGAGGKYNSTAASDGGSGGGGNGHTSSPWKDGGDGTQATPSSGLLAATGTVTGYGNDGGDSNESHLGGGGGGAGAVGGNNAGSGGSSTAGIGGVGIANYFRGGDTSGTTAGIHIFGGGGGGGNWQNTLYAAGGNGGGGAGGGGGNATTAYGTDGTQYSGGGGGGSGSQATRAGGDGGSGIVVIRYAV